MSLTRNSHPIVTRVSRVSRAPPRLTLQGDSPAFLNLHGILTPTLSGMDILMTKGELFKIGFFRSFLQTKIRYCDFRQNQFSKIL